MPGEMKSTLVIFPGTNREQDMVMAIEQASGTKPELVWHNDANFPRTDLIIVPGGFSYGDYLRSGAMAARSPAMNLVAEYAGKGVPVLGVCNGFQILTEVGLLPGALIRNKNLKFILLPQTFQAFRLFLEHQHERYKHHMLVENYLLLLSPNALDCYPYQLSDKLFLPNPH